MPIDYQHPSAPLINGRMTDFYGLRDTPTLPGSQRLLIELLSPAERPIQLTADLAQFWAGSYPKHYWPDDPANARATTRTKKYMDAP